jgi:hypothetical protein
MLCPYCKGKISKNYLLNEVIIGAIEKHDKKFINVYTESSEHEPASRMDIISFNCPECNRFLILEVTIPIHVLKDHPHQGHVNFEGIDFKNVNIYPELLPDSEKVPGDTPDTIAKDFKEASAILKYSSTASSIMARRCFELIIAEQTQKSKADNLQDELDPFINKSDISQNAEHKLRAEQIKNMDNRAAQTFFNGNIAYIETNEKDEKHLTKTLKLLMQELCEISLLIEKADEKIRKLEKPNP